MTFMINNLNDSMNVLIKLKVESSTSYLIEHLTAYLSLHHSLNLEVIPFRIRSSTELIFHTIVKLFPL